MKVNFAFEEIYGQDPKDVRKLFRTQGLDPSRPYRARVSFSGVVIEQDVPVQKH